MWLIFMNDNKWQIYFDQRTYSRIPNINETRLFFTPNNAVFKNLTERVSELLNLDEAIGVADNNQLQMILKERGLIAEIEYHHSNVNI